MVQDTDKTNELPPQGPALNDNENVFVSAAIALSLLSPPTDNSNSQHINQSHIKCYNDQTHCCFLEYFNDPIPDDAVIYAADIPFQYNKIKGMNTKFIGNPIGSVFIEVTRNHEFLISQGRNKPNMSSDSINFGMHNTSKNCSNFVQVAPAHTSDSSHFTYHALR